MKVLILTGAGSSVSSGIPSYRDDKNGFWINNDIKQVCYKGTHFSPQSIKFYNDFREMYKKTSPNIIHKTIYEIQSKLGKENCKIYTQNIDTLLEEAGCEEVNHLHGIISEIRCVNCHGIQNIGLRNFERKQCDCGGEFRNNIIFYGERPDYSGIIDDLLELGKDDIFILIGSSCQVFKVDLIIKPLKCLKILNNLEKVEGLSEEGFDIILYDQGENVISKIKEIIYNKNN